MRDMSALDLMFLVKELKLLEGGRIDKIYSEGKRLLLRIWVPGKGSFDLYYEPGKLFVTEYKRKFPEPTPFCMLLRKHLCGRRIKEINQPGFERIVEIKTGEKTLILELFSKGNIILCDSSGTVIMPLEVQIWKDRQILPKKPYSLPPRTPNPFSLSAAELLDLAKKSGKTLAPFLAVNLGLSGKYAEEVCARAGLEKDLPCSELLETDAGALVKAMRSLLESFNPQLIILNGERDFAPFDMKIYEGRERKTAKSFTHVLDEFFSKVPEPPEERKELEKLERIKSEMAEAIKKLREREKLERKRAEAIYEKFDLVESIITGLRRAREAGLSWDEIKRRIELEDTPETRAIKEIREGEGIAVLDLGVDVEIDFRLSPQENAERYFELSKKAKAKLESALKERRKILYRMRKLKAEPKKSDGPKPKRKRKRKWFEKFRWFVTTDGFLVVAGRDATQNEVLFKKHLEKDDIVLHADIHGAPLTVVKSGGREITPLAVREASEFAAAYSSAWKRGISVDVYWVRPDQVSKTPPSGEYLPKGSFMIRGQKNYLKKMDLKIAVGVKIEDGVAVPICGNVQSVRFHSKYFVTVIPGDLPQSELAKKIKLKLLEKALPEDKKPIEELDLNEIQRLLPPGGGEIVS